jgi:hypothetical protein
MLPIELHGEPRVNGQLQLTAMAWSCDPAEFGGMSRDDSAT